MNVNTNIMKDEDCVQCKAERDKGFCSSCGTKPVEGKLCDGKNQDGTNCNEILKTGDNFCPNCGKDHTELPKQEEGEEWSEASEDFSQSTASGQATSSDGPKHEDTSETEKLGNHATKHKESIDTLTLENSATKHQIKSDNKTTNVNDREKKTADNPCQRNDTVEVHFYAIISKDTKFDKNCDSVFIGIDENHEAKILEKELYKDFGDCIMCGPFKTLMPRTEILSKQVIYSYCVRLKSKSKLQHEILLGNETSDAKRVLHIPDEYKNCAVWSQFDGFIYLKPQKSGWFDIKIRKGKSDAVISVDTFGYSIARSIGVGYHRNIKDVRQKFKQLFHCLKDIYGGGNEKEMIDALWSVLESESDILTKDSEIEKKVCLLLTIIFLNKDHHFKIPKECKIRFCKQLLIRRLLSDKILEEWEILKKHFPADSRSELCEALLEFSFDVQRELKSPLWLFLVPYIHFLNEQSRPFDEPSRDASHDSKEPLWWGIKNGMLKKTLDDFKSKVAQSWATHCTLTKLCESLKDLSNVDYLLPRTVTAALNHSELKEAFSTGFIPIDVCCAAIIYHFRLENIGTDKYTVMCLEEMKKQCREQSVQTATIRWLRTTLSLQMLLEFLEDGKCSNAIIVTHSANIFTFYLSIYDGSLSNDPENAKEKKDNLDMVNDVCGKIVTWVKRRNMSLVEEHKVWSNLFETTSSHNDIMQSWNNALKTAAQESYEKRTNHSDLQRMTEWYCKRYDTLKEEIKDILFSIVKKRLQETEKLNTEGWKPQEKERLVRLWSQKLNEDYENTFQHSKIDLEAILKWSRLPSYLEMLRQKEFKCNLSKDVVDKTHRIMEIIQKTTEELLAGTISVHHMELLSGQHETFLALIQSLDSTSRYPHERVRKVLEMRTYEYFQCCQLLKCLDLLYSMCGCLSSVDLSLVTEMIQKTRSKQHGMDTILIITNESDVDGFSNTDKGQLNSDCEELKSLLITLDRYGDSQCFLLWWKQACTKEIVDSCRSLHDVIDTVVKPLQAKLDSIANGISTQEITFQKIEQLFGELFCDNYDRLRAELVQICTDESCVDKTIDLLKHFRQRQSITEFARIIEDLRVEYNLHGDFEPTHNLLSGHDGDTALKDYEESRAVFQSIDDDMTEERLNCLRMFIKCSKLIKWLRATMKDAGLKDVVVFVDLATISAGESAEKMARVKSLLAAVTGYTSLIFDMTDEDDYKHVIERIKAVWKVLTDNNSLPENLSFANQHLDWFKHVKETRGEVEITSFNEANAINRFGIFTIGTNVGKKITKSGHFVEKNTELSDVIKLTVPADVEKGRLYVTEYNLDELESLQSKLMLVAGQAGQGKQGIENVERFTMVLDGVIRLSKIYIRLVSSGCVLFKNFAIKLFCEPNFDQPVCVILDFKDGGNLTQLKCRKTKNKRLENIIPQVATQMEQCLQDWIEFVNKNREEHHHLNYFTMNQLVIIQKEIATVCAGGEPSPHLYSLLEIAKRNCKKDDVIRANEKAAKEIKDVDNRIADLKSTDSHESENPRRNEFIKKLTNAKYERLVPFALEKFPNFETGKALLWCMQNKQCVEELEAQRRSEMSNITGELAFGDTQQHDNIATWMAKTISSDSQYDKCKSMLQKLEKIWKEFIRAVISNLQDYISLKQLGVLLRYLSNGEICQMKRTLPQGYDESSPNLVICQKDEILITTLSTYMMDEDLPLPQPDEVLMCSAKTTLEQVDIFLRRAIFSSNGKIHCLVNADIMDFQVCEGLYDHLKKYIRKAEPSDVYRLVIICGSTKEHSLSMISSLEKYRKITHIFDVGRVKAHIANKLKVHAKEETIAAAVDFERSTVRLVQSSRSGVGKTLYKQRTEEKLKRMAKSESVTVVSLPLHQRIIDKDYVIKRLLEHTEGPGFTEPRLFHIDVTDEVKEGVDHLLFNLLILGCLVHKSGHVWRKSEFDLYLIETMVKKSEKDSKVEAKPLKHQMLNLLPTITCRSPEDSMKVYRKEDIPDYHKSDQLFDEELYSSELYQKPYTCLRNLAGGKTGNLSQEDCLDTLIRSCRVKDPSWSEIHHFVSFLYKQISAFENNVFVQSSDLEGFDTFVIKFLIQMSKNFSSRSLNMSEEIEGNESNSAESDQPEELREYQMARTWESSPHPYLFFNADNITFTFIGFCIESSTRNAIDQNGEILEENIISKHLYDVLVANKVPVKEDFDKLPRSKKLERLCSVMGTDLEDGTDPDITYELTTDNVKKMMAIYMRFRCNIPVIIMGETGCGKTRLVKFLCEIMLSGKKRKNNEKAQNMIIVKVHGGTANKDIISKVNQAEELAVENINSFGENVYTVLFFDEANTTESIGLLKEIICDNTMEGKPLNLCKNLKLVAACNPYRRHPEKLIEKLEKAGLGYHVRENETSDKFGRIPLRRLVYRVQPLPQSLHPFVWDFGQLTSSVETLYIMQMVKRYMKEGHLEKNEQLQEVISEILAKSQEYMRNLKDVCSFVSLRDVDRVLQIMCWFYNRTDDVFFKNADEKLIQLYGEGCVDDKAKSLKLTKVTRSLILALGVCYHACLSDREKYRTYISQFFREPCALTRGPEQIRQEIECCEESLLDAVSLESNIAKNLALKENVFMMVICTELRIPLFLVGKPGSSKSLARLIVADAMQGSASKSDIFKETKQVQMISFQCSPHSTPDGITKVFRQCASFQKHNNLEKFVSVVVLDELGLAEDSQKLPLKTLHPLLEDGCQSDEKPEPYMKVGFVGISNWALDPAKMNRGIFVQRDVPDSFELKETAKGICQDTIQFPGMENLIDELSGGYLNIFQAAIEAKREFFGLRDFYCLLKMINEIVNKHKRLPSYYQLMFALKRNFSGLETVQPVQVFFKRITAIQPTEKQEDDPDVSFKGLINACINDTNSRHLLILTENYGALTTFQHHFLARKTHLKTTTIFGSSFRRDQEYTQVCRNIYKIRICMETGRTVILLNFDNLYESLYEALNQYYINFGGQRYVDLGLGTHRVKCSVHRDFKLIVVADKQTVYDEFPIPLINRLEKHFLTSKTMLTEDQLKTSRRLQKWTETMTSEALHLRQTPTTKDVGKVFIGFQDDACAAVVLDVWDKEKCLDENEHQQLVLAKAKKVLLWCVTPDAIVRIGAGTLHEKDEIQENYWTKQKHESITQYLHFKLVTEKCERLLAQVTTHAKLLTNVHISDLQNATEIPKNQIVLLETLTTFDTEQHFSNKIKESLHKSEDSPVLLIIQCDTGDKNANLIACARHSVLDICTKEEQRRSSAVHIIFIVQLTTFSQREFKSIQGWDWHSVHIDNLHEIVHLLPCFYEMQGKSIATLLEESTREITSELGDVKITESHGTASSTKTDTESNGRLCIHDSYKSHNKSLDLKQILLMCVQTAMTMVRDTGEDGFSITNRISLLLNLLQYNNDFVKGVGILLVRLLKERDKSSMPTSIVNWLPHEAATEDMIQNNGTLRRACLQTIERKLSSILAGIIAVLDTNENINMLSQKGTWKEDLWIMMLNRTEIFTFTYKDIVPTSKENKNVDIVVKGTGHEGHTFQSNMPFSWLIANEISEVLKCERGSDIKLIVAETPLLKLMHNVPTENYDEAIDCYIHDFVNMMYFSSNKVEMKVLRILIKSFENKKESKLSVKRKRRSLVVFKMVKMEVKAITDDEELLTALLNVHIAFNNLSQKLKYFCEINRVWDKCSNRLDSTNEQLEDDHTLKRNPCKDMVIQALYLLIESFYPEDDPSKIFDQKSHRETWLVKVYQRRSAAQQTLAYYGQLKEVSEEGLIVLTEARSMWSRVVVMLSFVSNVCKSSREENISIDLCCPLWVQLEDNVEMETLETLKKIEEFLEICYSLAEEEYEETKQRCSHCSKVLSESSRKLPCNHNVCDFCVQEISSQQGKMHCPSCQKELDINFFATDTLESRFILGKDKLADYRKRCTTFLKEIVSEFCLFDKRTPGVDVVKKLMSYPLETDMLKTGIDPNHAFNTFIFRLLIRTSEEEFRRQLEQHLIWKDTQIPSEQESDEGDSESIDLSVKTEELLLIVANCIEDSIIEQTVLKQTTPVQFNLENARKLMNKSESQVEQLEGIAKARICLANVAGCLYRHLCDTASKSKEDEDSLVEARDFCEKATGEEPRKFILKCLYRQYGFDALKTAVDEAASFEWIHQDIELKNQDRMDRYVVCGDSYVHIKGYFARPLGTRGATELKDFLQKTPLPYEHACIYLQMNMYWETVVSTCKHSADQVRGVLMLLNDSQLNFGHKMIIRALLHTNELEKLNVDIDRKANETEVNVKTLVFQWICILMNIGKGSTCSVLNVLCRLAENPKMFAKSLLPTMAQDDMYEHITLLRSDGSGKQIVYRCENGHPYVIKDCGRPWVLAKCSCGAVIGGTSHKLTANNKQDDGKDKTLTGHILGDPEKRKDGPGVERDLKPINCACIRFLLHLTLYAACTEGKIQDVHEIIRCDIQLSSTLEFLKKHIKKDIDDIQFTLNMNPDDVLIFCHHMLNSVVTSCKNADGKISPTNTWLSKDERRQWENAFDEKYIRPVVKDVIGVQTSARATLEKNNELVTYLAECNYDAKDDWDKNIYKNPAFWVYRIPVTLTHMKHTFQREVLTTKYNMQYPLLRLFFELEHELHVIRFIPSILKLQRILLQRYSQRFHKGEIEKISIGTLREEQVAGEETDILIQHVSEAWNVTRNIIISRKHVCLSEFGRVVVPKELCDVPITDDTSITVLIPSTDDKGICSYAMLEVLMKIQNEFLDEYHNINKKNEANVIFSTVSPKDITSAHLISFDLVNDIHPLVLANCSFHVRDSEISYDFDTFEKQFTERFVSTKSKIKITPFMEIDKMLYISDNSVFSSMMMLESKIPQVRVTPVMRNQICSEVREIPDVCQILSFLDIAIRALKMTGGDPDSALSDYMEETLKYERALALKMRQLCKLCHVRSLWMTLSIQKAFIMVTHGRSTKDIFENIGEKNHEPVPEENRNQFHAFLMIQSQERLYNLLDVLFEYITLEVSKRQNEEDEDYIDESSYPLNHCIYAYASTIDKEADLEFVTWEDDSQTKQEFPSSILRKHCLHTWVAIAKQIGQGKAV